ncbi:hypothetical protein [Oceanicola sp. S124]|uniref:hypothetical protein n=1 Tax=Oceanicola sp. S124 TaxID=1042378 RepID=UPI0002557DC5|nr:hypothetical protein [Oceanicola sp. S124]
MRNKITRDRNVTLDMLTSAVDEAMQQLAAVPAEETSARVARRVLDSSGVYALRQALSRRGGIARLPRESAEALQAACLA